MLVGLVPPILRAPLYDYSRIAKSPVNYVANAQCCDPSVIAASFSHNRARYRFSDGILASDSIVICL